MTAAAEDGRYRNVPEPGQLVEVRRRQWVVAEVDASKLGAVQQHAVILVSIDEDALGEELQVIWEIEPGAHVIERAGLPAITGQDDSDTLEAFLDAVRWGAATNADRGFLQAPFRSGVTLEDFQLDPLVRAIDMARVNLLIADDVGLGKTIEAGLVIQEMLLRHRARTVLIVCPASLQEKWRLEMAEKFGLEFRIVDSTYIKEMRRERGIHANPWNSFPRLITSMDWAKAGEGLRAFRDILPAHANYPRKFDLLVVDEAHNVAPAAGAQYALESQRTRLIRTIAPHFQHHLFLTATPHNGYTESFTSLLELLDDQRFARNILPDEKQLAQVMIRRLKSEITDKDGQLIYAPRKLEALGVDYTAKEREIHHKLQAFCASREVADAQLGGVTGVSFINQLLKKRLFSSPAAFASTLAKHIATLENGAVRKDGGGLSDRILLKAIQRAEEDYANDADVETAQQEAIEEATRHSRPLNAVEHALLDELRQWSQQAMHQTDSKAKAILSWIDSYLKINGDWNGKRVILFTEYRTTLDWLQRILATHDLGGDRLMTLHGGMDHDDREMVKAAFQAAPDVSPVRILLATDAASEGIDLQNYCNYLIHLEIPYNPNVMEQRNGRIDRHGQRAKEVLIWHPVDAKEDGEAVGGHKDDILRALRKLDSMRADMGSVNPVIAPQMSGLIEGSLRDLDTHMAEVKIERARRFVRSDKEINSRVAKLHERLIETKEGLHLSPEHILMAVKTALALAEKPALQPLQLAGFESGAVFELPPLGGAWERCREGLDHPFTGKIRPVTFDHEVAKGRDDLVLVHLNHRLVQMCLRLLRAEVWAQEDNKKLNRVTVRVLPDDRLDTPAVVVVSRLVITGGNHHRLHEELTVAGGYLREQGFKREEGVTRVQALLDEGQPSRLDTVAFDTLRARFDAAEDSIQQTLKARSRNRLESLGSTLEARKNSELKDISAVLIELERAIGVELGKAEDPEQLTLFSEDERTQLRRDNSALEARLARIPVEREQEIRAIEARYAAPQDRTFPVAVIFIVPASFAQEGRV
ncbi:MULTISPECIES: DISARM system SNF2-like helicase DrmD [Pseudomonas]|uniref:Helicase n=1 Tax=Pseudomonas gorinensis TaxID=3240790 RepID=A0ACA7PDR0_9PSED|nr:MULTISPECIES: DISARM system SNF2-like helicase DrmD [unclassified Pseudomonas]AHC38097.1 helicase [Pseudomonas sp. TKP]SDZ71638.1 SNF2 family N-terminal domain-containing protein [Pseudomonas sp. PDC86]